MLSRDISYWHLNFPPNRNSSLYTCATRADSEHISSHSAGAIPVQSADRNCSPPSLICFNFVAATPSDHKVVRLLVTISRNPMCNELACEVWLSCLLVLFISQLKLIIWDSGKLINLQRPSHWDQWWAETTCRQWTSHQVTQLCRPEPWQLAQYLYQCHHWAVWK